MPLGFELYDSADTAVAAGVFIPVADLWNVSSAELVAADAQSRVAYGLLEVMANPAGPLTALEDKLGIATTYPNPVGVGTNLINQTYTVTVNYVADLSDNTIDVLPLPVSNVGAVNLDDVFPGAVTVAAAGAVAGAGIVVPTALLQAYGGPAQGDIDVTTDSRDWLNAFALYIADNVNIRSASVASAVTAANPVLAAAGALPNAAQIAASGLSADDNTTQVVLSRGVSVTIQKVIDTETETIAPRHVVA